MHSKKGIGLVLETLIGVVIAAIVVVYIVVPILSAGYKIIVPSPSYSTEQGFIRLADAIQTAGDKKVYVPVQINAGLKITTSKFDSYCVENCICLCKQAKDTGCLEKIYRKSCFKTPVTMFDEYLEKPNHLTIFEVSRNANQITLGGTYSVGSELARFFEECTKNSGNFAFFTNEGPILSYQQVCMACSSGNTLDVGIETGDITTRSITQKSVKCERYSYSIYSQSRMNAKGDRMIKTITKGTMLPKGEESFFSPALAEQQCSKDPCNVGPCSWNSASLSCEDKPAARP